MCHNDREKVSALEAGRDDSVIELLKILATTTITNNNPYFYPSRIFYAFHGGKEMLRCYDAEGKELQAFLSDEHYQIVKKGFWNKISYLDDFYPPIFDAEWANRFIESE